MTSAPLADRLRNDLVIVLVSPQHPENVGGTLRAMANMGLDRLVVVAPAPSFDPERVRWMAPGEDDLLARVRIVASLDEALEGVHVAVGTTARHRRFEPTVVDPDGLADAFFDTPSGRVTAVLFGREDFGLHAEELARCSSLLRIPTAGRASLNLAQAVLLVTSRLFAGACARGHQPTGRMVQGRRTVRSTRELQRHAELERPVDLAATEPLVQDALLALGRVGYLHRTSPELVGSTLRSLLQRAQPSERELRALRGMVHRTHLALDRPPSDDE